MDELLDEMNDLDINDPEIVRHLVEGGDPDLMPPTGAAASGPYDESAMQ